MSLDLTKDGVSRRALLKTGVGLVSDFDESGIKFQAFRATLNGCDRETREFVANG